MGVFTMELVHVLKSRAAKCLHLAVRPEGANHQWRKIPPGELSIDPVANERLRLGNRQGWSLVAKAALGG